MEYIIDNSKNENAGKIADRIFASTGLKLKADSPGDEVHGYVSTTGSPNNKATIVFYEKDEAKNGNHESTFKKATTIPTKTALESLL